MTDILELRHVRHRYNGLPVLQVPALKVEEKTITGLIGPNGSGKSTLLKIMAFVEKCTEGEVLFEGEPALPFSSRVRSRVSLLIQEPHLLKRTVFDNVAYGLSIRGERTNLRARVAAALELVGLPETFAWRQWRELSGGEAQRVALAARLALQPRCLLLDEPTASVDMRSAETIRQAVLMARREWKTTIIIASHHRPWLDAICDRLIFLFDGRIVAGGIENIVLGPWKRQEDGRYGKTLADGQLLAVSRPPHPESICTLPPEKISLTKPGPAPGQQSSLQGAIVSIFQESGSRALQARVACGEHHFTVNIVADGLARGEWFPGQKVGLRFSPVDIVWLHPPTRAAS